MKFLLDRLKKMLNEHEFYLESKPYGIERIAPFGNRTSKFDPPKPLAWMEWLCRELPHYHRRKCDEKGRVLRGQGLNRHRLWQTSPYDRKLGDRFYSTKIDHININKNKK